MRYKFYYSNYKPAWRDTPNYPLLKVFDNINFDWKEMNDINPQYISETSFTIFSKKPLNYIKLVDLQDNNRTTYWLWQNIKKRSTEGVESVYKLDIWSSYIINKYDNFIAQNYLELERLYKKFIFKELFLDATEFMLNESKNVELFLEDVNDFINVSQHPKFSTAKSLKMGDFKLTYRNAILRDQTKQALINKYYVFDRGDTNNFTGEEQDFEVYYLDNDENGITDYTNGRFEATNTTNNAKSRVDNSLKNLYDLTLDNTYYKRFRGVYRFLDLAELFYDASQRGNYRVVAFTIQNKAVTALTQNFKNSNFLKFRIPKKGGIIGKVRFTPSTTFNAKSKRAYDENDNIAQLTKRSFFNTKGISGLEMLFFNWYFYFNNGFKLIGFLDKTNIYNIIDFGGEQFSSTDKYKQYVEANKNMLTFNLFSKTIGTFSKIISGAVTGGLGGAVVGGLESPALPFFAGEADKRNKLGFDDTFVGDSDVIDNTISTNNLIVKLQNGNNGYNYYNEDIPYPDFVFLTQTELQDSLDENYSRLVNEYYIKNGVKGSGKYNIKDLIIDNPTLLLQHKPKDIKYIFFKYFNNIDKEIQKSIFNMLVRPFWLWTDKEPDNTFNYTYNMLEIIK